MKVNPLIQLKNIPITSSVIASLFPAIKAPNNLIAQMEKSGELIRLKKGVFVVSPAVSGEKIVLELVANHLHGPSYVSKHTALRYYGLIPEAVYEIQSMTCKRSKVYTNSLGRFSYDSISDAAFPIGITNCQEGECSFLIASPEKALCDLIAQLSSVNLRYLVDAQRFLEEDIRLDMEAFYKMDVSIFEQYALCGKKSTSIQTIIKFLRNGRPL